MSSILHSTTAMHSNKFRLFLYLTLASFPEETIFVPLALIIACKARNWVFLDVLYTVKHICRRCHGIICHEFRLLHYRSSITTHDDSLGKWVNLCPFVFNFTNFLYQKISRVFNFPNFSKKFAKLSTREIYSILISIFYIVPVSYTHLTLPTKA